MSDYLSDDLWLKILLFLPVKSVVRFSSVCRLWNTVITSSYFINDHLNQVRVSTPLLFLRYCVPDEPIERYSLRFDNSTFDLYKTFHFPFQTVDKKGLCFRILGSCNGLICLADDLASKRDSYILWNPSIQKSLTLPVPRFTYRTHGAFDDAIGFGFDSRTNDHQVVRLVFFESEEGMSPRVELFKLSTGSWEAILATIEPGYWVRYNLGHVFSNGAAHWIACDRVNPCIILSFDMSEEVFHKITLPVCLGTIFADHLFLFMTQCGQCLSLINYTSKGVMDIWVMRKYGVVDSWTKFYTLDPRSIVQGVVQRPISITMNCEMLLEMNGGHLFSYDGNTQRATPLGIRDQSPCLGEWYSSYVGRYEESLVLLGYKKGLKKDTDVSKELKGESGDHKEQASYFLT